MLLQETTPNTTAYLILGLAAFVVLGGGYIVSLITRARNLQKEGALIQKFQEDETE